MDNEETDGQQAAPEETAVTETAEDSAQVENEAQEATASDDEDGGDDTANAEEGKKPAKGVQKRLDELTRRYHEERRDKERLLGLLERGIPQSEAQAPRPVAQQGPPQEADFSDYDEYQSALIDWRVEQKLTERQQHQTVQEKVSTFQQRAEQFRASNPDFDAVAFDPALPVSATMKEVILDSDLGPDIAYYLGTNLSEASRISALPQHRQAAELGKLEAKLSAPKQQPAPRTPPPAPPKTVSGLSAGLSKPAEDMSMAEYVAARQAGQI